MPAKVISDMYVRMMMYKWPDKTKRGRGRMVSGFLPPNHASSGRRGYRGKWFSLLIIPFFNTTCRQWVGWISCQYHSLSLLLTAGRLPTPCTGTYSVRVHSSITASGRDQLEGSTQAEQCHQLFDWLHASHFTIQVGKVQKTLFFVFILIHDMSPNAQKFLLWSTLSLTAS